LFALLASRPVFGLRLFLTDSASALPFSRLAQCSFSLWSRCSLIPPSGTFGIGGFVFFRSQHPTLRLLPAGATVAGGLSSSHWINAPFSRRTRKRAAGYHTWDYYHANPDLREAIDLISSGCFSHGDTNLFRPLVDSLIKYDPYMVWRITKPMYRVKKALVRLIRTKRTGRECLF
jgi:carbohydrate phosphorylase